MEAYLIDAVRIPRGRFQKGALASLKSVELLKPLYQALEERNQLDPHEVEDVVLGCVTAVGDQGANISKISSLYAGWSDSVSGATVNRFCTSGLDACNIATAKIMSGMEQLVVAGGVESMSRVPMFSDGGAWFKDPEVAKATRFLHMGISADLIASLENYDRSRLDEVALQSQHRSAYARDHGHFSNSLIPVKDQEGNLLLETDETIRSGITLEKLGQLPPSFAEAGIQFDTMALKQYPQLSKIEHLHHAGTSPSLVDGASLLLIASPQKTEALQLKPRARIRHFADACGEPILMLTGHIKATQKLLKATGLSVKDIDLFEVNESFAASVLKYQQDLDVEPNKMNVNGGAIAMGHPLGATGGLLIGTLLDELERRDLKRGVVAICAGAGIGVATLIERL